MKNTTIITTVLSILVTVAVGWLTIKLSAKKYEEAEYERSLKVQEHIVRLIEQDIINQTPLSSSRLERLIEAKCNEQTVNNNFSILKLIQIAELNLLSSDYLDIKQKDIYKNVFDTIFNQMTPNQYLIENDSIYIKNPELIEETIKYIQDCNVKEATTSLEKIISLYNNELKNFNSNVREDSILDNSKYKKYFYLVIWQMILTMTLLIVFQMFRKKLLEKIEYGTYRKFLYAIMIYSMVQIIPIYLVILL